MRRASEEASPECMREQIWVSGKAPWRRRILAGPNQAPPLMSTIGPYKLQKGKNILCITGMPELK
jgi:hypothetical protein